MGPVNSYLGRIGCAGPLPPTLHTLRAIHHAHMLTVPFENLDIGLGRRIVVNEDAFLRKVVEQHRGGFCYELNGAFAALLRALGFQVTLLSARVARPHWGEGPEFDHLTLRVDLPAGNQDETNTSWLVDVGFGESFVEPLQMQPSIEQRDPAGTFRLIVQGERWQLEKSENGGTWAPQYSFSLQPRRLEEFAGMCHYHQTSPDSSFTQNRLCSRATPRGRITLSENKLITTRNGHREERFLTGETERIAALRKHFGISL